MARTFACSSPALRCERLVRGMPASYYYDVEAATEEILPEISN